MPTICKPLVGVASTSPLTPSAIARALAPRVLYPRTPTTIAGAVTAAANALALSSNRGNQFISNKSSQCALQADYTFPCLSFLQTGYRHFRSRRACAVAPEATAHSSRPSSPAAAMAPPTIISDARPPEGVNLSDEIPATVPPHSANAEPIVCDQPQDSSPGTSAPFKKQRVAGAASDAPDGGGPVPAGADGPNATAAATSAAAAAAPAAAVSTPAGVPTSAPAAAIPAYVPPPHVEAAWAHFRRLGSPRLLVAPMVDQSELPFRRLCAKYGAQGAYTPMFHSRLFVEDHKYRREFTTCSEDRPLFVQFCANNPDTLVKAASLVAADCDYVDINFGCPQRIARRGRYGAFLMDDLPLVESLVSALSAARLPAPVSCKIRIFPDLARTIAYARMLEAAGCYLLAVHGRTREQKDGKKVRADWEMIRRVKESVSIPVIANGNIRDLADVVECLEATGCDGVLSAESLLENPALFGGEKLNKEYKLTVPWLLDLVGQLRACEKGEVGAERAGAGAAAGGIDAVAGDVAGAPGNCAPDASHANGRAVAVAGL
ncbi:unnamed protein product [Closterium sp. NIES-65]|nr:unnamed protein product [Closterium sp. NIES-65]